MYEIRNGEMGSLNSALSLLSNCFRNRCALWHPNDADNRQLPYGKQILCQFSLCCSQVSNFYADTRPQGFTDYKTRNTGERAYFWSFPTVTSEVLWIHPAARIILGMVSIFWSLVWWDLMDYLSYKGGTLIVSHIRGSTAGNEFNRIETVLFNLTDVHLSRHWKRASSNESKRIKPALWHNSYTITLNIVRLLLLPLKKQLSSSWPISTAFSAAFSTLCNIWKTQCLGVLQTQPHVVTITK